MGKLRMSSGKFLGIAGQLGYDIILMGMLKTQGRMHKRRLDKTVYSSS